MGILVISLIVLVITLVLLILTFFLLVILLVPMGTGADRSNTGDVGGEEVHRLPVEVAAFPLVVLGGFGSAWRARICGSRSGTPASSALVIAACRSECGLMCRGMPAALAILVTIRYASCRSIGLPVSCRSTSGPLLRSPRQASSTRRTGTVIGIVAGLLPCRPAAGRGARAGCGCNPRSARPRPRRRAMR